MKKVMTALVAATTALAMNAEGYQVNTFSAKQDGMGHVGVALKLGAESQMFNPAAVSFMNKTMMISGGLSAIKATAKATVNGTVYESSNKVSTPMNISAAFRIYDNLYAGVSFYTPYGSSINWGKSWPGAVLNQSVDLQCFTVQPTLSWRITDRLSIGAGLMIAWGSVDLNKALVSAESMDAVMDLQYEAAMLKYTIASVTGQNPGEKPEKPQYKYGMVAPASVNLKGNSELALGFNVGAMFDINDQWTVGASFRSKMNLHVKAGAAAVEYADEQARTILGEQLDNLNYTNFDASMPCPYVFTVGVSYKPIERLTLAFDAQLNGWKAYDKLDIAFANLSAFDQHLVKNYKNAMTYHVGGEFALTKRFDVRAGVMVDCNPCDLNHYNPETPGTTKIEPSLGFSFRPIKGLSIDVAFMYVHGTKVNGATGQYEDFLASSFNKGLAEYNAGVAAFNQALGAMGLPAYKGAEFSSISENRSFTADYKVYAFIPAIGVSYSF